MKLGFFFGIDGNIEALRGVFDLLVDCDLVVSLGDLVAKLSPFDAGCLELVENAGPHPSRVIVLAGRGERERAHDRKLPLSSRVFLRRLMPAWLEQGIALLGGAASARHHGSNSLRDHPRFVAKTTVAPGENRICLWRSVDGVGAKEILVGDVALPSNSSPVQLSVGRAVTNDGVLQCAVLDLAARRIEVRERLLMRANAAPCRNRR